ncbi:hypothetical protein F5141DRAFT_1003503 [Pisolithus sp. B1]|nr:hypothetical protein F5141DRAFT_1003503 [Pisolithus sp. B1]
MFVDQDMGEDSSPIFVAPGDEAFTLSHEGSEHEAFEDLAWQVADMHSVHYTDLRTRHDHIELQTEHWMLQMDRLVNAYLNYCYCDMGDGLPAPEGSEIGAQCLVDIELIDMFSKYVLHSQNILLNESSSVSCNTPICTSHLLH